MLFACGQILVNYRTWNKPLCVLHSNLFSQQSHTHASLYMTGNEWEDWADGCDSHVLRDSCGSWWWWQATHNVLFTVWVCSLSVTSECSLATAFITAFRGAANWKWNCGWASRQAQATLCGKCYLIYVGCLSAQFVILFLGRKTQRCIWRFSMCTQAVLNVSSCPESPVCTHWAGNEAICPWLTFMWLSLNVYDCVRFLF